MKKQAITAFKFLLIMTILTGVVYPVVMTETAQLIFHWKANGSRLIIDNKIVGSELIGQRFDSSIYFWSRPSHSGYNAVPSGASNLGPTSDTLKKQLLKRRVLFAQQNLVPDINNIPKEMVFSSASGLDPQISPEGALIQVGRIAKARHLNNNQKNKLLKKIHELTESPQFLIFGEPGINVLKLNIELDNILKENSESN